MIAFLGAVHVFEAVETASNEWLCVYHAHIWSFQSRMNRLFQKQNVRLITIYGDLSPE